MVNRKYILVLCLLSLVLCLTACRPKGILHSWEMRALLVDLHKTDAMMQVSGLQHKHQEDKALYYAVILEKHGTTQAQFDSSLVWYTAHPQLFDKIYPRVLKDLKAEEERFIAMHAQQLEPELPSISSDENAPKECFTQAQWDSVLWINIHGFPSSWNEMPLMQDSVNQLFPQIGVLR